MRASALSLAALALLASCGGAEEPAKLPMSIGLPSNLRAPLRIQILFAQSDQVSCVSYRARAEGCYRSTTFGLDKLVTLTGSDGKPHKAYAVDWDGTAKTLSVGGIPIGHPYSVIVETSDASGNLSARECAITTGSVKAGMNDAVSLTLQAWTGTTCNPSID